MTHNSETLACTCAHLADERQAEDILVLNVGPIAFFTDFFVIATGRNERQIRAIAEEIRMRMKTLGWQVVGTEGGAESGWVLIDLGEAIIHLFSPEMRQFYDLGLLWGVAPKIPWQEVQPLTAAVANDC